MIKSLASGHNAVPAVWLIYTSQALYHRATVSYILNRKIFCWVGLYTGVWKYHARPVRPGPILFRTSCNFLFTCPWASTNLCIKLIQFCIIIMSSHVALKTVWILISWLLQKPADLDLHCLQDSSHIWFHISKE